MITTLVFVALGAFVLWRLIPVKIRGVILARLLNRAGIRVQHRARFRLGPFSRNYSAGQHTSDGVRVGWFSRNSRRPGRTRIDLPGGFHTERRDR